MGRNAAGCHQLGGRQRGSAPSPARFLRQEACPGRREGACLPGKDRRGQAGQVSARWGSRRHMLACLLCARAHARSRSRRIDSRVHSRRIAFILKCTTLTRTAQQARQAPRFSSGMSVSVMLSLDLPWDAISETSWKGSLSLLPSFPSPMYIMLPIPDRGVLPGRTQVRSPPPYRHRLLHKPGTFHGASS